MRWHTTYFFILAISQLSAMARIESDRVPRPFMFYLQIVKLTSAQIINQMNEPQCVTVQIPLQTFRKADICNSVLGKSIKYMVCDCDLRYAVERKRWKLTFIYHNYEYTFKCKNYKKFALYPPLYMHKYTADKPSGNNVIKYIVLFTTVVQWIIKHPAVFP